MLNTLHISSCKAEHFSLTTASIRRWPPPPPSSANSQHMATLVSRLAMAAGLMVICGLLTAGDFLSFYRSYCCLSCSFLFRFLIIVAFVSFVLFFFRFLDLFSHLLLLVFFLFLSSSCSCLLMTLTIILLALLRIYSFFLSIFPCPFILSLLLMHPANIRASTTHRSPTCLAGSLEQSLARRLLVALPQSPGSRRSPVGSMRVTVLMRFL